MAGFDTANQIHPSHPAAPVRPRRSAFTLVELVLVTVLIALVSALAVPRYANFLSQQRLDAAANRLTVDLAAAQRRAKHSGASVTVRFEVPKSSYKILGLPDPDHPDLEYRVALSDEPYTAAILSASFGGSADLIFDGYGTPQQGGSVVVQVGARQQTITIDAGNLVIRSKKNPTQVQTE